MSSVWFKFKSQREPSRVQYDGHITVWELKKEIIRISKLESSAGDFDLSIYAEDTNEEYDDDTTIVPRSTTVIAKRIPAVKAGQGRAARYVTGKAPINAKNASRTEQSNSQSTTQKSGNANGMSAMNSAQTEEERIQAMFMLGGDQWEQQKQQMSGATAVHRPGNLKGKLMNVPDHEPPPGYICYRCGLKGHWIQACPTNNDPTFDGRPRVKRTTGIPKSFLQTVEKPLALVSNDGLTDESRQSSSVMIDAEGNFVVSVPDRASWEQYQAKAQASAAQQDVAATGSKDLRDRGLECPIDKRLFVDPMKTPCCGRTYCNDCIENALINSDLVCPGCSTDGVLIDNLTADEEMTARMKSYADEKKAEKKDIEKKIESPKPKDEENIPKEDTDKLSMSPAKSSVSPTLKIASVISPETSTESSKKRAAEEELKNDRKGNTPDPSITQKANFNQPATFTPKPLDGSDQDFIKQMNALASTTNVSMPMPFPNVPIQNMPLNFNPQMNPMGFPGMPMNFGQPMNPMAFPGMPMGMPMGMPFPNGGNMFNGFSGLSQQQQQQNWQGWNGGMAMPNGNGQHQQQFQPNQGGNQLQLGQTPQINGSQVNGPFSNQQFSQLSSNEDDNAYMRKPVNPHRHQGRQKKARPTDYREL